MADFIALSHSHVPKEDFTVCFTAQDTSGDGGFFFFFLTTNSDFPLPVKHPVL